MGQNHVNARKFVWHPERLARLKELAASGKTSTAIGEIMGVSKNAIVGKCNREGIALISRPPPMPYKIAYAGAPLSRRQRERLKAADRAKIAKAIASGKIMRVPSGSPRLGTDLRARIPGSFLKFPTDELLAIQLRNNSREAMAMHYDVTVGFIHDQVKRIGPAAFLRKRMLPADDILAQELQATIWADIADAYGVTKAAVYRAAERLGIPKLGVFRPARKPGRQPREQVA